MDTVREIDGVDTVRGIDGAAPLFNGVAAKNADHMSLAETGPSEDLQQQTDMNVENVVLQEPKRVLLSPYISGFSERLRSQAFRYQITPWFSYGGRLGDGFTHFKDKVHVSKSRYAVYNTGCSCGMRYIGETERNLKVRLKEHKSANSNSALSEHLRIGYAHVFEPEKTEIVSYEKHIWRRKIVESLAILHNSSPVCNAGPSTGISDLWSPCFARLRASLAENG